MSLLCWPFCENRPIWRKLRRAQKHSRSGMSDTYFYNDCSFFENVMRFFYCSMKEWALRPSLLILHTAQWNAWVRKKSLRSFRSLARNVSRNHRQCSDFVLLFSASLFKQFATVHIFLPSHYVWLFAYFSSLIFSPLIIRVVQLTQR